MKNKILIGQLPGEVKELGTDNADWYVFWTDAHGNQQRKNCGPGMHGKHAADDYQYQMLEGEPVASKKSSLLWLWITLPIVVILGCLGIVGVILIPRMGQNANGTFDFVSTKVSSS